MTIQEIIQQARNMSVTDQMHLVSQLVQLLEQTMQKTVPAAEDSVEITAPTSAVGIIADLIKTPVAFDGTPLTRGEIYER
ncbi:MAG: hypothetical protein ACFB14_23170 [Leptolyngbyaceae cyanobacterium]